MSFEVERVEKEDRVKNKRWLAFAWTSLAPGTIMQVFAYRQLSSSLLHHVHYEVSLNTSGRRSGKKGRRNIVRIFSTKEEGRIMIQPCFESEAGLLVRRRKPPINALLTRARKCC